MARTTIDIDTPILRELKELQKVEGKSLGRLVSELLAEKLHERRRAKPAEPAPLHWVAQPMRAIIDLSGKEELHAVLDGRRPRNDSQ